MQSEERRRSSCAIKIAAGRRDVGSGAWGRRLEASAGAAACKRADMAL